MLRLPPQRQPLPRPRPVRGLRRALLPYIVIAICLLLAGIAGGL